MDNYSAKVTFINKGIVKALPRETYDSSLKGYLTRSQKNDKETVEWITIQQKCDIYKLGNREGKGSDWEAEI